MRTLVLRRIILTSVLALAAMATSAAPAPAQTASFRVIGGSDVPITRVPFQVRLRIQDLTDPTGRSSFLCGGSIVDSTHVVTAAHCVTDETTHAPTLPTAITVYYGSSNTSSQRQVGVSSFSVPAQYTTSIDDSYDIAKLTLRSAVVFSSSVQAIQYANAAQPKTVGNAFVTGFGLTSTGGSTSSTLKGVTVPLRTDAPCQSFWGSTYVSDRSVCAGGGSAARNNPDTCNGDSGGPLAVDIDNRTTATKYVLLGLTSYGTTECGQQNAPAVYTYLQGTDIQSFLGVGTTSSASTSGNFEPIPRATAPSAPTTSTPASQPAARAPAADRTKPRAKVAKVRCKHRRCTIRLNASDKGGGTVKKLSVRIRGKVRKCRADGFGVTCKTVRVHTKKPRAKKVAGGYRVSVKLKPGRYSLSAVATDTSGNRSAAARKRFRVRR